VVRTCSGVLLGQPWHEWGRQVPAREEVPTCRQRLGWVRDGVRGCRGLRRAKRSRVTRDHLGLACRMMRMMMMMMVVAVVMEVAVGMRGRAELKGHGVMLRRRMRRVMVAVPHVSRPERVLPEAGLGGVLPRLRGRRVVRVTGKPREPRHARRGAAGGVARSPRRVNRSQRRAPPGGSGGVHHRTPGAPAP